MRTEKLNRRRVLSFFNQKNLIKTARQSYMYESDYGSQRININV